MIGAGAAGLVASRHLLGNGLRPLIFETSKAVGGEKLVFQFVKVYSAVCLPCPIVENMVGNTSHGRKWIPLFLCHLEHSSFRDLLVLLTYFIISRIMGCQQSKQQDVEGFDNELVKTHLSVLGMALASRHSHLCPM